MIFYWDCLKVNKRSIDWLTNIFIDKFSVCNVMRKLADFLTEFKNKSLICQQNLHLYIIF